MAQSSVYVLKQWAEGLTVYLQPVHDMANSAFRVGLKSMTVIDCSPLMKMNSMVMIQLRGENVKILSLKYVKNTLIYRYTHSNVLTDNHLLETL